MTKMTWNWPIGWPRVNIQAVEWNFERLGIPSRKIGRPIEGGPNTPAGCQPADCESADVCDPFLGLCLGCGSRLCWKLEHRCFLPFKHVRSLMRQKRIGDHQHCIGPAFGLLAEMPHQVR